MKKLITIFIMSMLLSVGVMAKTTNAQQSGQWDRSTTWDNGIPACGDIVNIQSNRTVTITAHVNLDENSSCSSGTTINVINGRLRFNPGKKMYLACGSIINLTAYYGEIDKVTGGGNANLISICQQTLWNAGMGDVTGPMTFGVPVDVCDVITTTLNLNRCFEDSVFAEGAWQNISGLYTDSLLSADNCDSLIQTVVTFFPQILGGTSVSICAGDSIWTGGSYQDQTPQYQTQAGTYYHVVQALNGCDSLAITTVTVLPSIATTTVNYTICADDSVLVGGSYQNTAGTYYDTLTSVNGCDSVVETILTVNALPYTQVVYGFISSPYFQTLYFWNVINPQPGMTYQWSVCSGDTVMEDLQCGMSASYFTDSLMDISVTITDSNGCSFTKQCLGFVDYFANARMAAPLGDDEIGKEEPFKIYPNPASDNLTIEMEDYLDKQIEGRLMDMSGRMVQKVVIDEIFETIDVSELNSGTYILQVGDKTATIIKK